MPKGKIAVIEICYKCPYNVSDTEIGVVLDHKTKTKEIIHKSIHYCGWFKPIDPTKLRIEEYLDVCDVKFGQPENCPLPVGNDNSKWRNIYGEDTGRFPNSTNSTICRIIKQFKLWT